MKSIFENAIEVVSATVEINGYSGGYDAIVTVAPAWPEGDDWEYETRKLEGVSLEKALDYVRLGGA